MKNKTIDIISLGCSKNLVDSEILMGLMEAHGYNCTHDSDDPQGEIAVVNTCGFINDAKEESINTILEFAQAKTEGRLEKLFVMGCLSERYLADLEKEIPEVDGWYGKFNYKQLLKDLEERDEKLEVRDYYRHITTPRDEVRQLVKGGTKEFNVIAQELTYYGVDLDGKQHIAELIERMAEIPGVEWIRLHYAYPAHFPWDLLRVMREKKNVCNYLDIALQHISDHMLSQMQRHVTKEETYELIRKMREEVPGIHIRTTLMVGFPGETDEDFEELKAFVKWARFERMGAFTYSEEEGTFSEKHYKDDIPEELKQQRLDKLMRIQQHISAELEAKKVSQILKVIIDRREGNYYVGRTEFCSPEVDPEVLISVAERDLEIGEFYQVKITDSEEFDLYGTTINL